MIRFYSDNVEDESKSLQEINKECVGKKISHGNNIFERQVDGENSCENLTHYCDRHEKVKTLPTANKSNSFYFMGRSNQLKRPALVLPKIPFATTKKGRKLRPQNREAEIEKITKDKKCFIYMGLVRPGIICLSI